MYFACNVNIYWLNVIYSSEHNLYSWYLHCEHWLNVTINTMWTLLVKKLSSHSHTWYLSFFLHQQNVWRIKFTPKKRVNYDKIHSKLPNFCVITAKYTVNCQFFCVKSVKIYTGQFFFTQTPSVVSVTTKRYVDFYTYWLHSYLD